ncbi:MAG: trypsin-like peptidase domain-containing protein [Lachnospiraceae bacterium]|nr:trypsin-like peptidase domain-containing protein [Lachnospiraceae bacterium]
MQDNNNWNNEEDIPRWNPSPDDYNTQPPKDPTPKRRWLIPLVIVAAVMIISIVVGVWVGISRMRKDAQAEKSRIVQEEIANVEEETKEPVSQAETTTGAKTTVGGIVLTDVTGVVEEVMPAVVSITSRSLVSSVDDYFSFFFGRNSGFSNPFSGFGEGEEVESGIGSGTIISQNDTELLILTSYHVVEGSSSLYVTFADDASVDGYVKGVSEATDIAIVAVPLSEISESTLGAIKVAKMSMESARVGEGVVVIGNALGYGMSVTSGIISAVNRTINVDGKTLTVIQTDAAINSGNSGGCLLNSKGEIIGISEAKINSSTVEGMCYAIPIDINSALIQELLEGEATDSGVTAEVQGAYLGIRGRDISAANSQKYGIPEGIYVSATVPGGGAEAAGILEGDVIIGIDGVNTTTMAQLQAQLAKYNPGDYATLTIMRESGFGYEMMNVDVMLTDMLS